MMRDEQTPWGMSVNHGVVPPPASHRFLGGPPLTVLLRLLFVSVIVGALLMWLHLEPLDVVREGIRAIERLWAMGYDALGDIGRYLLAGAVIVVPVWLVIRLLSFRPVRQAAPAQRWTPPGAAPQDVRSEPRG